METNPTTSRLPQTQSASRRDAAAAAPAGELSKDDFLMLLTTQLSQQDPLSPVDNQAFVEQLSQMASVERLAHISTSIEQLAMAQSANTSAQMVSFIGHQVEVDSGQLEVAGAAPSHAFGVELDEDAAQVSVTIKDEQGRLVRRLEMGARSGGAHEIAWDGLDAEGAPVPDGTYTFEVRAEDDQGEPVVSSTFARREVTGVSFEQGFPRLTFGDEAQASLGQVRRVVD